VSEIFSNMFGKIGEVSVYFSIKGEDSVIQASLREEECNLLYIIFCVNYFTNK